MQENKILGKYKNFANMSQTFVTETKNEFDFKFFEDIFYSFEVRLWLFLCSFRKNIHSNFKKGLSLSLALNFELSNSIAAMLEVFIGS